MRAFFDWIKRPQVKDIWIPSKRSLGEVMDLDGVILNYFDYPEKRLARIKMQSGKVGIYQLYDVKYGGHTDWHYVVWKFKKYDK